MSQPRTLFALLALLGCQGNKGADTGEVVYEGDDGSECTDGGDNDRDGYFDCEDNGCWGSPDCEGQHDTGGNVDTDTDTQDTDTDTQDTDTQDTDTDTDTDSGTTGASVAAHLTSYTLTYTLSWDFSDDYEDIIESWGLADCTAIYEGSGTQIEASDTHVTFEGPWTLTGGDCPEDQTDPASVVWYSKTTGEGYATFWFYEDMSMLDAWVAHKREGDIEPIEDATAGGQWYITDMEAPFDGATATYEVIESTSIEGLIPLDFIHTFTVTFGTD